MILQWGTTSQRSEWPQFKSINNKCWRGCEEKGYSYAVGENLNWCNHWKTIWRFLIKLKVELLYDPALPNRWHTPRQSCKSKRYLHPSVPAAQFTICKTWKQPQCPSIEGRIKKIWNIYVMNIVQMEHYSAIRKKEIMLSAATAVDLEITMLSEVSQKEKGRRLTTALMCGT